MRLIFLDIDGVLNDDDTEDRFNKFIGIDPKYVNNLKTLYDTSNEEETTRVVISSSWRMEKIKKDSIADGSFEYLLKRLNEVGIEVIGITPQNELSSWYRGREIQEYMDIFYKQGISGLYPPQEEPISTFVILDDEDFEFSECGFEKNLVLTCFYHEDGSFDEAGLNGKSVERALKILRGEEVESYLVGGNVR